jgi:ATP synthase F1 complex assembly factor 1
MIALAQKYPNFVIPLPRDSSENGVEKTYEVYYMQWGFHGAPSLAEGPAVDAKPSTLPTSTILFTPLQEYKLRESFATPYLVLTFFTELSRTHGLVLLRGEITSGAGDGKPLLCQADAHQLASALQKFYLSQNAGEAAEKLVRLFHEQPEAFNWEELLPHVTLMG